MIQVKVITKNASNKLIFEEGKPWLKLKISAVPEKGKANAAIIEFLSKSLKISKSQIRIVQGETSNQKKIEIQSPTPHQILKSLQEQL
ncbi:MAG: DUF167 domain-containing protein [Bdellovibrionales bacterium]|nr:DUF167 domain-containing protein [Bdellovibrionales bacterium]